MKTDVGKAMRLKRVIDPDGVSVICALDHGMTSPTFLEPLADITQRTREAVAGGSNVIMMSKGMIRIAADGFSPTTSLALLLSASASPDGDRPEIVQIAEVEEALTLGADAVVLFTALGGDTEAGMIDILSAVGRECAILGMPFIAEAEFPTTYATVEELKQQYGFEYLRRNVRLCAELGADIVKTNWPGDQDSFAQVRRGRQRHPGRARRRLPAGGRRAALPHGTGDGGRCDRLLGGTEHLHAPEPRGDHAGSVAGDPRTLDRREGARRAARGDRLRCEPPS